MRRGIFILIAVVCLVGQAFAQSSPIDKGSRILDGGLSYTSVNSDFVDYSVFTIDPLLGIFVSPGFLIGGRVVYQHTSSDFGDNSFWGLGPEIRYYFDTNRNRQEIRRTVYPFLRTGFLYMKDDDKNKEFDADLGVGLAYMLSDEVSAVLGFNFTRLNFKADGRDSWVSHSQINFSIGFSFFLY